ncbi:MAG: substrate-binding domain-containing protein [Clostridiales bacterium]|nr:substrate-binding domain-containing protein [Clostridiales bacterium]
MKKLLSLFMVFSLCIGVIAGCSKENTTDTTTTDTKTTQENKADTQESKEQEAEVDDGKLLIYGIYKAGDQTWFIDEGEAARKKTEEHDGEFVYVDSKMNPEECLKAVDNAIANNADGIVMCIPDQTMSQAVVDKCKEAGIPIVAADDALEVNGEKIAPWVGIDAYNIGAANGEWMANYIKDNNLHEDPEVGIMYLTMETVSSCVPRTQGEKDKIGEILPDFDPSRVFEADTDGTTDKGNTAATAVITAHPEIKKWMVMTANEETAVGAVRALETAGLDKESCVIGLGAYLAKDEWNQGKDTCMRASCYFSADSIGGTSVEILINYIKNGTEMPMEMAVPAIVVTPDTYKDVMGDAAN